MTGSINSAGPIARCQWALEPFATQRYTLLRSTPTASPAGRRHPPRSVVVKISLIIDARLTGKELPRRLAEARQQVTLFQGRGEILVIDDGDMAPPLLGEPGEHAVVGYRQVRSRPAPMGGASTWPPPTATDACSASASALWTPTGSSE